MLHEFLCREWTKNVGLITPALIPCALNLSTTSLADSAAEFNKNNATSASSMSYKSRYWIFTSRNFCILFSYFFEYFTCMHTLPQTVGSGCSLSLDHPCGHRSSQDCSDHSQRYSLSWALPDKLLYYFTI